MLSLGFGGIGLRRCGSTRARGWGVALLVGVGLVVCAAPASAARPRTAFVVNEESGSVTLINTATNKAGAGIAVGSDPLGVAVTPDGKTAYVTNRGSDSVTPINTATRKAGAAIIGLSAPFAVAVTPDGKTAYVTNQNSGSVTPINTTTNKASA